jgi:hypothetical protein
LCFLPICLTVMTQKPTSVTLDRSRHSRPETWVCGKVLSFCVTPAPLTLTRLVTAYHGWNVTAHPHECPDLVPSDSHICVPHKKHLDSKRFATDTDVKQAVTTWLQTPDTFTVFARAISAPVYFAHPNF